MSEGKESGDPTVSAQGYRIGTAWAGSTIERWAGRLYDRACGTGERQPGLVRQGRCQR